MFIRAYLRASTKEQDAKRAKSELIAFANDHGHKIAAFYIENESGATLERPKLMQLIDDAHEGDVILVEQIDRLARLNPTDWDTLKQKLSAKRLSVVSKELPTSYMALQQANSSEFMDSVLRAINDMLLDMLAAIARKDYEDRRNRQMQGIARAKSEGKYKGRRKDIEKRKIIASLLKAGHSYSEIQVMAKCSRQLIAEVIKESKSI
ncbi:recombinase family protein [Psychrobacter sp. Sarcosine-3u-12]|uniref:recombinase family protein n=1 Tax=Psychrobacter sp. Sarcosine-3u-12 TaxID=2058325 RepID=UPI000C31D0D5|nr:recombinase family protein [Psychrobacter sp. Sarcosine-3u-12]PKG36391.1 resolvase [Psychrobacter sp. Sarcosine-3u-12]